MSSLAFCRSQWSRGLRRRSAKIVGSNLTVGRMFAVSVVFCQVDVLPTVVGSCVRSRNLINEEALAQWVGAVQPKTKIKIKLGL
jgi:hypothetical protein